MLAGVLIDDNESDDPAKWRVKYFRTTIDQRDMHESLLKNGASSVNVMEAY